MSRVSLRVCVFALTLSAGITHAGQVTPQIEATRAAQNALRNGADRTVTVTIGMGRSVPPEVTDAALPMPLAKDESLVIKNASGGDIWLRFSDDGGLVLIDATIPVRDGESKTLYRTDLLKLAGPDLVTMIQVADATPPRVTTGPMRFRIEAETPETQDQADEIRVRTAQELLLKKTAARWTGGTPPLKPERFETTLDVESLDVATALSKESLPLPVERMRHDGQLIGHDILFVATTRGAMVTFKKDGDSNDEIAQLPVGRNGGLATYSNLKKWAGRDGTLKLTVDMGQGDPWTGYLTLNVSPLEIGRIFVPIDLTGVSDWRFVNPRRPARIGPIRDKTVGATLEFVNRVPGRTIKVTFPPVPETLKDAFEKAGFEVQCSRPKVCPPTLVLQAANRPVEAKLLVDAYGGPDKEGLVEFTISFFEGDIEPANSSGYLAVVPRPYESSFSTSWNAAGNAGFVRDAHFAAFTMSENDTPIINTATPFDDQTRRHLTGSLRLSARPQLGSRANAEVDLIVKDKDFGAADAPTVTTQKARVNVFGFNGFSLSFGRFDFAAPTRSIAIAESGEGISGRWRRVTVSHVVRPREKLDKGVIPVAEGEKPLFAASPDVRDRWSTLAQVQFAPCWVRIETSGLIGRRKTLNGAEGLYFTGGGDVIAANGFGKGKSTEAEKSCSDKPRDGAPSEPAERKEPTAVWRLNTGFYVSRRQAKASAIDATEADHGWTGLVDGSVAWLGANHTPRVTIGATAAMASRDDTTTKESESYAGESASFVPDKIFLATLAGKVASLTNVGSNGEEQSLPLSGGLTGKKYLGAGVVYQGFSPLEWLALLARIPQSEMGTRSVTVRWHQYSLRNPIVTSAGESARSWLGHEAMMEWLLESPRGVRYTLTGAYFAPGELLKAQKLILSSTWYVDARVTVTLK